MSSVHANVTSAINKARVRNRAPRVSVLLRPNDPAARLCVSWVAAQAGSNPAIRVAVQPRIIATASARTSIANGCKV